MTLFHSYSKSTFSPQLNGAVNGHASFLFTIQDFECSMCSRPKELPQFQICGHTEKSVTRVICYYLCARRRRGMNMHRHGSRICQRAKELFIVLPSLFNTEGYILRYGYTCIIRVRRTFWKAE